MPLVENVSEPPHSLFFPPLWRREGPVPPLFIALCQYKTFHPKIVASTFPNQIYDPSTLMKQMLRKQTCAKKERKNWLWKLHRREKIRLFTMYLLVWVCFFNHFLFSPSTKSHNGCILFARHFFLATLYPPNKSLTYRTTSDLFSPFSYSVCFCSLRPSVPDGFSCLFFSLWS